MVKLRVVVFDTAILLPLSSCRVKLTMGVCPADSIGHAGDGKVYAGQQRVRILRVSGGSIGGHHVCAHDGRIEGHLALRDMAVGALRVVGLGSTRVVDLRTSGKAGCEIDVVMAAAASGPRRLGQKCSGLRAPCGF